MKANRLKKIILERSGYQEETSAELAEPLH